MAPYALENTAQRDRLVELTGRLTDEDLNRWLPNGWSVAAKLVHVAFWDRFYLSLIQEWELKGFAPVSTAVDPINEAVRVLSRTIPPGAVVPLVRDAAEAIDRKVAGLPQELVTAIEDAGYVRILNRAMHRREHLDQIEQALSVANSFRNE